MKRDLSNRSGRYYTRSCRSVNKN